MSEAVSEADYLQNSYQHLQRRLPTNSAVWSVKNALALEHPNYANDEIRVQNTTTRLPLDHQDSPAIRILTTSAAVMLWLGLAPSRTASRR